MPVGLAFLVPHTDRNGPFRTRNSSVPVGLASRDNRLRLPIQWQADCIDKLQGQLFDDLPQATFYAYSCRSPGASAF